MNIERKIEIRGSKVVRDYAMCMLLLQDQAGLSYKEARAVLYRMWESIDSLAKEFDISYEGVYNLVRRGDEKVKSTGKTVEEICGEYRLPICLIDPRG